MDPQDMHQTAEPLPHLGLGAAPPQGSPSPEDCLPEFPTDGDLPSYLNWDVIPMNETYLTLAAGVTNQTECQAACSADAKCQYYVWYSWSASGNSDDQCYLRLSEAAIAGSPMDPTVATHKVLFEVGAVCVCVGAGSAAAAVCEKRQGEGATE